MLKYIFLCLCSKLLKSSLTTCLADDSKIEMEVLSFDRDGMQQVPSKLKLILNSRKKIKNMFDHRINILFFLL